MEENKKRVPELRFPEFTDEWEERKFGDLGSVGMCKRIFKEQTAAEGDIPFYKIGTFGGKPDAFITRKLFEEYKEKFQYPKFGDMLISASGTIGRIVEYTGEEAYFQDSNIVWFNHDSRVDNSFLKCIYTFVKWSGIEGSTIKRLYNDNFLKTKFFLPQVEEQRKIGAYFSKLDEFIELHQQKLEHWKEVKKGLLQKMFPKKDSKVPEVRFPEFTDDWEQRKFDEIYSFLQNNALSRAELNDETGDVLNVHYGDILIKYGEVLDVKRDKLPYITDSTIVSKFESSVLQDGDIIIADAAEDETVGKTTEIAGLKDEILLSGLHTIPCRPKRKFARGFLGYYMNSSSYHDQLLPLIQGTKISSISKSIIQNTDIKYPISEKEQQKIGAYFSNLDNLITLHQRKLDHLKELKKGLLQKMFI